MLIDSHGRVHRDQVVIYSALTGNTETRAVSRICAIYYNGNFEGGIAIFLEAAGTLKVDVWGSKVR